MRQFLIHLYKKRPLIKKNQNFCINPFELHMEISIQACFYCFSGQNFKKSIHYLLFKFCRLLFENSLKDCSMNWSFIGFLIADMKNSQYRHWEKKALGKKERIHPKEVQSWFSITRQIRFQEGWISNEATAHSNKKKEVFWRHTRLLLKESIF